MEDTDAQRASNMLACSHHEVEILQDDKASYPIHDYAAADQVLAKQDVNCINEDLLGKPRPKMSTEGWNCWNLAPVTEQSRV
jgi:hypothetical protein